MDYSKLTINEFESNNNKIEFSNRLMTSGNNLNRFIDLIEIKLNESIELHDLINENSADEKMKKELQRANIENLLSSANFFQTLLNWLILFTTRSLQPLNLQILRIIPLVNNHIFLQVFIRSYLYFL